jgi:Flp pilus assembly protein TadG
VSTRSRLLGDEQGQTLVFFVATLAALLLLLAFVLDIGALLATKHKLQTVADGAALTAIQAQAKAQDPSTAASNYVLNQQDLSNVTPSFPAPPYPNSFTVTATHDAPVIFGGIAGIPGVTVQVSATARIRPVLSLDNAKLTAVTPTPAPYVVPLVVNESSVCSQCSQTLHFDSSGNGSAGVGAADICMDSSFSDCKKPPDGGKFKGWIGCSQCVPGNISAGPTALPVKQSVAKEGADAIDALVGTTVILPVFDPAQASYTIVGFAAFAVSSYCWNNKDGSGSKDPCKDPVDWYISGNFVDYPLPASFSGTIACNDPVTQCDFGVRAFGLTS